MGVSKKALKIPKALKSAARFPGRVSGGRGSGRSALLPLSGEQPIVILRVHVQGCNDLVPKDKNGLSDPFVSVSFMSSRFQTSVVKKTLNPSYNLKDGSYDFPVYSSLVEKLGALEFVVWDKDMLRKDYLGEAALTLEHWFPNKNAFSFEDSKNVPFSVNLISTRASTHVSGTIKLKIGFIMPQTPNHEMTYDELYRELTRRSKLAGITLTSAPPTEGIGTVRTHQGIPGYEDDGLSSDEGEVNTEDEDEREESAPPLLFDAVPSAEPVQIPTATPTPTSIIADQVAELSINPTAPEVADLLTPVQRTPKSAKFPKMFPRRPTMTPAVSSETMVSVSGASTPRKKPKFKKLRGKKKVDYNFSTQNDILGIVMLEIKSAEDLPRVKNMTRLSWDMDPFVVASFGKKVFRTRVIRHSLNPIWDEKLIFHVRRYEAAFKVQLTVLDWDKLTSNDHVGDASFDVSDLLASAPQPDPETGLYTTFNDSNGMKEMRLNLTTMKTAWESKHNPVLTIRAKYQPYAALRQRFWRQYLKQYDSDDSGSVSRLELTSMLDSLGSTLSSETITDFFAKYGKNSRQDELTIDEAVRCLETEVCRPTSEKRRISMDETNAPDTSYPATPMVLEGSTHTPLALDNLDFSGPPVHPSALQPVTPPNEPFEDTIAKEDTPRKGNNGRKPILPIYASEPPQLPVLEVISPIDSTPPSSVPSTATAVSESGQSAFPFPERQPSSSSSEAEGEVEGHDHSSGSSPTTSVDEPVERVINIKNCPLCHRPRLNSKAEMDIVTHIAICASQDWTRMDRIVVGNFVTASQAQRKWYTKIISKVSSGDYKLGANSANIIVQNRLTGQLEEEKMQVYVRLGIRLLYKGAKSRMEGARARRLLRSLSIKQGIKYDSPESAREIPAFIEFHRLNVAELLDPLDSFKTFNQFFYRKLKPDARPVESPEDPSRLVSAADCRMLAFESVTEATQLWIKGRDFTVSRLLGDAYRDEAERYHGGALAIFRLAPQDYHRYHSPVDGVVGAMSYISGEYYTVNPQAVRTALDVYGENARKIVPIDSPTFGRVMCVCVGAMMVGSIKTTVSEGEEVKRGQEIGYFAFGGSTIVVLFEKGAVEWDEDLLINGRASLETLVRVGMGLGRRGRRHPSRSPSGVRATSGSSSPVSAS